MVNYFFDGSSVGHVVAKFTTAVHYTCIRIPNRSACRRGQSAAVTAGTTIASKITTSSVVTTSIAVVCKLWRPTEGPAIEVQARNMRNRTLPWKVICTVECRRVEECNWGCIHIHCSLARYVQIPPIKGRGSWRLEARERRFASENYMKAF